jgi:osmotically-inducible protein OsmY
MDEDRRIQKDVEDELAWEPSIDEANIGVSVNNGIVTLSGQVVTYSERFRTEKAALRVRGVRAVANDLIVEIGPKLQRTDAEIAQSALTAIGLMVSVPKDRIQVVVRDREVTLEGDVEWDYHRKAAGRAVRDLAGVKKVINLLVLKPRITAKDIQKKITAAIHRSAQLDADHVQAEVDGSRVTLRGSVSSWEDKRDAERTAWSAPGVTDVRNLLVIQSRVGAAY